MKPDNRKSCLTRRLSLIVMLFLFLSLIGIVFISLSNIVLANSLLTEVDSLRLHGKLQGELKLQLYETKDKTPYYAIGEVSAKSGHDASGTTATVGMYLSSYSGIRYKYYQRNLTRLIEMEDFSDEIESLNQASGAIDNLVKEWESGKDVGDLGKVLWDIAKSTKEGQRFFRKYALGWSKYATLTNVQKRINKLEKKLQKVFSPVFENLEQGVQIADTVSTIIKLYKACLALEFNTGLLLERLDIIKEQFVKVEDQDFQKAIDDLRNTLETKDDAFYEKVIRAVSLRIKDGTLEKLFLDPTKEEIFTVGGGVITKWLCVKLGISASLFVITESLGELYHEFFQAPRNIIDHYILSTLLAEGYGIDPTEKGGVTSVFSKITSDRGLLNAQLKSYLLYLFYDNLATVMDETGWVDILLFWDKNIDRKFVIKKADTIKDLIKDSFKELSLVQVTANITYSYDDEIQCNRVPAQVTLQLSSNPSNVKLKDTVSWFFFKPNSDEYQQDIITGDGHAYLRKFEKEGEYKISAIAETNDGKMIEAHTIVNIKPSSEKQIEDIEVWPTSLRIRMGEDIVNELTGYIKYDDETYEYPLTSEKCESFKWLITNTGIVTGDTFNSPRLSLTPNKIGKTQVVVSLQGHEKIIEVEVVDKCDFSDVQIGSYYARSVHNLCTLGILKGRTDGTFGVGQAATRAEFLKIILLTDELVTNTNVNLQNLETVNYKPTNDIEKYFTDVPGSHWASGYIKSARDRKIISGDSGDSNKAAEKKTTFRPDQTIFRSEAAKIIANIFVPDKVDLSSDKVDQISNFCSNYNDVATSEWYCKFITALKDTGIMKGYKDGTFGKADKITREQVAHVACKAYVYSKTSADEREKVTEEFCGK